MELRKGRHLKRKPLSDTTNCPNTFPPPLTPLISVGASTAVTATTRKRREPLSAGKLQFDGSIVKSSSSSRRAEDEERQKENQSPAFSPSSFTSPGISASEISYSERVYKRRHVDQQRLSAMVVSSVDELWKHMEDVIESAVQEKKWSDKEGLFEPGSSMMQTFKASIMMRRHYGMEASNEDRQFRICRSAPAVVKQKKQRHSKPEIPKRSAAPEDNVEERKAHFAEVDAFELQEEAISSDELD